MRNHRYFIAALAFAGMAFAQDAQDKPKTQTDAVVPQADGGAPTAAKPANGPRRKPAIEPTAATPKTVPAKTDVPLTPNAEEAVRVSEQWMASKNAPAAGPDGKVSLLVRCRAADCGVRAAPRLHHRIAVRREDHRRATDRRLRSLEPRARPIRQGRGSNLGHRVEAAVGGARYEPSHHHGSSRVLPPLDLQARRLHGARRVRLSRRRRAKMAGPLRRTTRSGESKRTTIAN